MVHSALVLLLLHLSIATTLTFARTSQSPAQGPSSSYNSPRSFVAVEGVVFCKSCKFTGVDTLTGATPLQDAHVKIECNTKRGTLMEVTKTDSNGYFLINGPKSLITYGSQNCKVSLLSSPDATCNRATNLHAGQVGASPISKNPRVTLPAYPSSVELFTVGPFAFEPSTNCA